MLTPWQSRWWDQCQLDGDCGRQQNKIKGECEDSGLRKRPIRRYVSTQRLMKDDLFHNDCINAGADGKKTIPWRVSACNGKGSSSWRVSARRLMATRPTQQWMSTWWLMITKLTPGRVSTQWVREQDQLYGECRQGGWWQQAEFHGECQYCRWWQHGQLSESSFNAGVHTVTDNSKTNSMAGDVWVEANLLWKRNKHIVNIGFGI